LISSIGLELIKAYIQKGWRVIAAVRDPSTMPDVGGEVVVAKLDVGEKDDAKKVCLLHLQLVVIDNLGGRGIEEERDHCC
jgi:putative NADH-flavin reductase